MIHLIYGTDKFQVKVAGETLLAAKRRKYPDLTIFRFVADDYSREKLEEVSLGQTLFAEKFAVVCDGFLSAALEPIFINRLAELHASPNLFILLEEKLTEKVLKPIADVGGTVRQIKKTVVNESAKSTPSFNQFAIADALGERDRKRAWIFLQEALAREQAAEDIFWKLFWKVKTMLLVNTAKDQSALGLKPFVLQQANRHRRNFSLDELKQLSARLVAIWHDRFRGLTDLELGLERLVLEL